MGRAPSLTSLKTFNSGLKQTGVKYRIRANNQTPRIQIRAVERFEDGSHIRTVDLYHAKPGDLEKARDLCMQLEQSNNPLEVLLRLAPAGQNTTSGWGLLIQSFKRYLDEQGIQWREQCQAKHIRDFEQFKGSVNSKALMQWVEEAAPKSSDRVRRLGTLNKLLICTDIDISDTWLKRITATTNFSSTTKAVNPRELPTDEEIEAFVDAIPNKNWQRAFGTIATYGLRPHEIFCVNGEIDSDGLIEINSLKKKEGQEGWRFVVARRRDWIERWELTEGIGLEFNSNQSAKQLGHRTSTQFRRYRLHSNAPVWREKASTYDLRHAYAAALHTEARFEKVTVDQASQWMGHARKVHIDTYLRWLSKSSAKESARRIAAGLE